MIYWSVKTLWAEPMRLVVSAFAVAFSFVLVVFFSAVFEGESIQMVAYFKAMKSDIWVMQKGVANMHMASSMVWDWKADRIKQLPGVKSVKAILYLNGPIKAGGKDWFSYIIGLSPQYPDAGPWRMAQGKSMPNKGEAIIPEVMSQLADVHIGEDIIMIDRTLKIVGLSKETFSMASSVVFVSRDDLGDLLQAGDQYSYIMVSAANGVNVNMLQQRIKDNVEKVNVLGNTAFIESDRQLALQMGAEIITMMTLIGTLLASLIVAFSAYSLLSRKRQELAIAKALGYSTRQLYAAALCQGLVISLLGLLFTLLLAYTVVTAIPLLAPQINLLVSFHQFVSIAAISIPTAIVAALLVARNIARTDPMLVFNS